MWTLGTRVDPQRPACRCLVGLAGILNPRTPTAITIIDVADWQHWKLWGWTLIGIDVDEEPALELWLANHKDE